MTVQASRATMRAFVVTAPRSGGWRDVAPPVPWADEVLVRVSKAGLCGTDAHIYTGESPNVRLGLTPFPWRPGHEWSGVVVARGENVRDVRVGARVVGDPFVNCGACEVCRALGRSAHCPNRSEIGVRGDRDGALAELLAVPAANLSVVPDAVSDAAAVLAEPATTALHALEVARLRPGSRAAVLGTGTLGLIVAQVAAASGAEVTAVGVDPVGLALAASLGARTAAPGEAQEGAFDAVIEASGAPPALGEATRLVAIGGTIGLIGFPAEPAVPLDAAALVIKGARIEAVLGGIHRMGDALRLIECGIIDTDALIDAVHPWNETAELFDGLSAPKPRPKTLIDLSGLADDASGPAVDQDQGGAT